MTKKTAGNPLIQLLSSLEKQEDRDSYLILVQHSLSFSQRQTAASTEQSLAVYQHANVKPPSQRARRDSCGNLWISAVCHHCTTKLVWVETIGCTIWPSKPASQTAYLSLSSGVDPLGWDNGENATAEKITIANFGFSGAVYTARSNLQLHDCSGIIDAPSDYARPEPYCRLSPTIDNPVVIGDHCGTSTDRITDSGTTHCPGGFGRIRAHFGGRRSDTHATRRP